YFLLSGQPPYSAPSLMGTLIKHRDAPIPSLSLACPEKVPSELEDLFRRMLAKSPADRPQSMSEIVQGLTGLLTNGLDAKVEHSASAATVPLARPTLAPPATKTNEYSDQTVDLPPATAQDAPALNILLVEPSRTQAAIIRTYLQGQSIDKVATVATGQEAL